MKKLFGLLGLVSAIGCASGLEIPVSHGQPMVQSMNQGDSMHVIDGDRMINIDYYGPEDKTSDGTHDDIVSVSMYQPFYGIDTLKFHVGNTGRFYAFGFLFDYNVLNDNDSVPLNNVFEFSVKGS